MQSVTFSFDVNLECLRTVLGFEAVQVLVQSPKTLKPREALLHGVLKAICTFVQNAVLVAGTWVSYIYYISYIEKFTLFSTSYKL